jgi:simple sugar transport system substrate-binding protein
VTVTLAVALTACTSQGGAAKNKTDTTTSAGQVASNKRFTIAMVTHETPGDTFWNKIRAGAQAAAKKDNIDLKYSNDPSADKQAGLIQNAVDSKVDGIATTLVTPDALAGAVKAAQNAKIPIVGFNSGISDYKRLGVPMYFGSDEDLAGNTVGQRLAQAGAKNALCVIQAEGSVALEARCAGVKKGMGGGKTSNIQVNGADISAVQSTLTAKLQQDKSIDSIVTLGAPIAMAALQSMSDAGSKAKLATFDLNAQAAQAIKDGKIAFSVDQQPYVQGYLAVDSLWLNLTNANDIGGGQPVLTGPSFVDPSNIDAILTYAKNNTR